MAFPSARIAGMSFFENGEDPQRGIIFGRGTNLAPPTSFSSQPSLSYDETGGGQLRLTADVPGGLSIRSNDPTATLVIRAVGELQLLPGNTLPGAGAVLTDIDGTGNAQWTLPIPPRDTRLEQRLDALAAEVARLTAIVESRKK